MVVIFTITMFVSATILFLVQPMVAKMILPLLGGTPAVWNTCMVFYQAALLAGYVYAHLAPKWLGARRQAMLHVGLLLVPLLVLPIAVPSNWAPPTESSPALAILLLLVLYVGLPFFVVSANAPMLQRWFAETGHPAAKDPYFLYAASNLGSMFSLLGYPLLFEPNLRLSHQSWAWAAGYVLLAVLVVACAVTLWRAPRGRVESVTENGEAVGTLPDSPAASAVPLTEPNGASRRHPGAITAKRRLRWVLLSLVPSSLMLGVTTHISTDIASVPLLWVVPLAIYLLTFVLVFASQPMVTQALMVRVQPLVILVLAVCLSFGQGQGEWVLELMFVHLIAFLFIALVCHGELAADRPKAKHLTEFYLWMSIGGLLGGMFNSLLAPVIFNTIVEYRLVLVLACLLRPVAATEGSAAPPPRSKWLDLLLPLALGGVLYGAGSAVIAGLSPPVGNPPDSLLMWIRGLFLLAVGVCWLFRARPVRFGLGVAAIMLSGATFSLDKDRVLHIERSFFGVHRVVEVDGFRKLVHGTTLHGAQSLDPRRIHEPLAYYHRSGPLGQVFATLSPRIPRGNIAVCGLGTGSIASYAQAGQRWTFYEIDPSVKSIASDPRFFTFLRDCPAIEEVEVVLGDARLKLASAPEGHYDLIVVDCFSSDAIPMHLLSREAMRLYLSKLKPRGQMAFNISNRFLELTPVLGNLAHDAQLSGLTQLNEATPEEQTKLLKFSSQWVVLTRAADRDLLPTGKQWTALAPDPTSAVWTDDFSNILSTLKSLR